MLCSRPSSTTFYPFKAFYALRRRRGPFFFYRALWISFFMHHRYMFRLFQCTYAVLHPTCHAPLLITILPSCAFLRLIWNGSLAEIGACVADTSFLFISRSDLPMNSASRQSLWDFRLDPSLTSFHAPVGPPVGVSPFWRPHSL